MKKIQSIVLVCVFITLIAVTFIWRDKVAQRNSEISRLEEELKRCQSDSLDFVFDFSWKAWPDSIVSRWHKLEFTGSDTAFIYLQPVVQDSLSTSRDYPLN